MTEVNDALDNFEETNPKPIINVYVSEADRAMALKMAFALSEFVLENMMKAALIYKMLDPNFYQALGNASRISKVGIRHEEPTEVPAQKMAEMMEVQEQTSTSELLDNNLKDLNAQPETPATPVVLEPSSNGV
jgi:hypothetical protein